VSTGIVNALKILYNSEVDSLVAHHLDYSYHHLHNYLRPTTSHHLDSNSNHLLDHYLAAHHLDSFRDYLLDRYLAAHHLDSFQDLNLNSN
jgi:hypothetical protein